MTLDKATFSVTENSLELMVLERGELPPEFHSSHVVREGVLDNQAMARQGFAGNTAERLRSAGRVTGYMREFGVTSATVAQDGLNFLAATVAHLFDSPASVSEWMHNVFLKDFEENVGESVGEDHQLISARRLEPNGFFDEAVTLKVLQGGPSGLTSSTVVDFRVGRILGVAFVGTVGDHQRLEMATQLGLDLEKRIVRVVLGAG
jgi:hypothetical protein